MNRLFKSKAVKFKEMEGEKNNGVERNRSHSVPILSQGDKVLDHRNDFGAVTFGTETREKTPIQVSETRPTKGTTWQTRRRLSSGGLMRKQKRKHIKTALMERKEEFKLDEQSSATSSEITDSVIVTANTGAIEFRENSNCRDMVRDLHKIHASRLQRSKSLPLSQEKCQQIKTNSNEGIFLALKVKQNQSTNKKLFNKMLHRSVSLPDCLQYESEKSEKQTQHPDKVNPLNFDSSYLNNTEGFIVDFNELSFNILQRSEQQTEQRNEHEGEEERSLPRRLEKSNLSLKFPNKTSSFRDGMKEDSASSTKIQKMKSQRSRSFPLTSFSFVKEVRGPLREEVHPGRGECGFRNPLKEILAMKEHSQLGKNPAIIRSKSLPVALDVEREAKLSLSLEQKSLESHDRLYVAIAKSRKATSLPFISQGQFTDQELLYEAHMTQHCQSENCDPDQMAESNEATKKNNIGSIERKRAQLERAKSFPLSLTGGQSEIVNSSVDTLCLQIAGEHQDNSCRKRCKSLPNILQELHSLSFTPVVKKLLEECINIHVQNEKLESHATLDCDKLTKRSLEENSDIPDITAIAEDNMHDSVDEVESGYKCHSESEGRTSEQKENKPNEVSNSDATMDHGELTKVMKDNSEIPEMAVFAEGKVVEVESDHRSHSESKDISLEQEENKPNEDTNFEAKKLLEGNSDIPDIPVVASKDNRYDLVDDVDCGDESHQESNERSLEQKEIKPSDADLGCCVQTGTSVPEISVTAQDNGVKDEECEDKSCNESENSSSEQDRNMANDVIMDGSALTKLLKDNSNIPEIPVIPEENIRDKDYEVERDNRSHNETKESSLEQEEKKPNVGIPENEEVNICHKVDGEKSDENNQTKESNSHAPVEDNGDIPDITVISAEENRCTTADEVECDGQSPRESSDSSSEQVEIKPNDAAFDRRVENNDNIPEIPVTAEENIRDQVNDVESDEQEQSNEQEENKSNEGSTSHAVLDCSAGDNSDIPDIAVDLAQDNQCDIVDDEECGDQSHRKSNDSFSEQDEIKPNDANLENNSNIPGFLETAEDSTVEDVKCDDDSYNESKDSSSEQENKPNGESNSDATWGCTVKNHINTPEIPAATEDSIVEDVECDGESYKKSKESSEHEENKVSDAALDRSVENTINIPESPVTAEYSKAEVINCGDESYESKDSSSEQKADKQNEESNNDTTLDCIVENTINIPESPVTAEDNIVEDVKCDDESYEESKESSEKDENKPNAAALDLSVENTINIPESPMTAEVSIAEGINCGDESYNESNDSSSKQEEYKQNKESNSDATLDCIAKNNSNILEFPVTAEDSIAEEVRCDDESYNESKDSSSKQEEYKQNKESNSDATLDCTVENNSDILAIPVTAEDSTAEDVKCDDESYNESKDSSAEQEENKPNEAALDLSVENTINIPEIPETAEDSRAEDVKYDYESYNESKDSSAEQEENKPNEAALDLSVENTINIPEIPETAEDSTAEDVKYDYESYNESKDSSAEQEENKPNNAALDRSVENTITIPKNPKTAEDSIVEDVTTCGDESYKSKHGSSEQEENKHNDAALDSSVENNINIPENPETTEESIIEDVNCDDKGHNDTKDSSSEQEENMPHDATLDDGELKKPLENDRNIPDSTLIAENNILVDDVGREGETHKENKENYSEQEDNKANGESNSIETLDYGERTILQGNSNTAEIPVNPEDMNDKDDVKCHDRIFSENEDNSSEQEENKPNEESNGNATFVCGELAERLEDHSNASEIPVIAEENKYDEVDGVERYDKSHNEKGSSEQEETKLNEESNSNATSECDDTTVDTQQPNTYYNRPFTRPRGFSLPPTFLMEKIPEEPNEVENYETGGVEEKEIISDCKERFTEDDTIVNKPPSENLNLPEENNDTVSIDDETNGETPDGNQQESSYEQNLARFNELVTKTSSSVKLLEFSRSSSRLHRAAAEGDLENIKLLVEEGYDVNDVDEYGWPVIHAAVTTGNFDCCAWLIEAGADLEEYTNFVIDEYRRLARQVYQNYQLLNN